MVAKGIEPEFAERVFSQILGFGEYGFPESHAASFALIAYATAYVRHHHPVVFACALLNAWPFGFYSPATVIDDSKRHHVKFLPIDILKSDWDCTLERQGDAADYAVRIGLRYVKGLGDEDWQRIKAWRAGARAAYSLSDFTSHCRLPSDSMERLAEVGAFDCFDRERRDALWVVLDRSETPTSLLVGDTGETPLFRPLSDGEEVTWDYLASGQSPRGHVMEQFRSYLEKQGLPETAAVSRMEHGRKVSLAGCAICRQMPSTASGVLFMTLEDESGLCQPGGVGEGLQEVPHVDPDQLDPRSDRAAPDGRRCDSHHCRIVLEARICPGSADDGRVQPGLQVSRPRSSLLTLPVETPC